LDAIELVQRVPGAWDIPPSHTQVFDALHSVSAELGLYLSEAFRVSINVFVATTNGDVPSVTVVQVISPDSWIDQELAATELRAVAKRLSQTLRLEKASALLTGRREGLIKFGFYDANWMLKFVRSPRKLGCDRAFTIRHGADGRWVVVSVYEDADSILGRIELQMQSHPEYAVAMLQNAFWLRGLVVTPEVINAWNNREKAQAWVGIWPSTSTESEVPDWLRKAIAATA